MPRGGRRNGKVGQAYSNRSDLQGASLHSAQYGDGTARAASTAVVPVQPPPTANIPAPPPGAPLGPDPGALGDLTGPTARPDEPITAGLGIGPGVGPEALKPRPTGNPDLDELRAIYQAHPSPALRELIEYINTNA